MKVTKITKHVSLCVQNYIRNIMCVCLCTHVYVYLSFLFS